MLKKVLIIITSIMCISLCSCGGHTKKSSGKLDSESVTYSEKDSKTDIVATLKYDNDETHNLIIRDETHEICGFTDDLDTINKILSEYFPSILRQNEHYLESDTCDCFLVLQECSVGEVGQLDEEHVYNLGKCYMLVFVTDTSTGCFCTPLFLITLEGLVSWVQWLDPIANVFCQYGTPTYTYSEDSSQFHTNFPSNNILLSERDIISLGFKERQEHIKID